jgi:predicted ATPase
MGAALQMLATLEWSYALLNGAEATVLRAISIFAASFETDSVVRVVAHQGIAPSNVFDAIAGLRSKSMLRSIRPRASCDIACWTARAHLLATGSRSAASMTPYRQVMLDILRRAVGQHATMPARKWHAFYSDGVDDLRKAVDSHSTFTGRKCNTFCYRKSSCTRRSSLRCRDAAKSLGRSAR